MQIELTLTNGKPPFPEEVLPGSTFEELAARWAGELPFPVIAARQDNILRRLNEEIEGPGKVELLDMRNRTAEIIVQNSLTFLYIKAVGDVLGKPVVKVEHSLNKGVYTEISGASPPRADQVEAIRSRMKELVARDLPFEKKYTTRKEALSMLQDAGMPERVRILEASPGLGQVKYYQLGDSKDFFYGSMVPSTGYLARFQLRKYKKGILLRFPYSASPDRIPPFQDERKMYAAFREATQWQNLLGISFVCDLNEKIRQGKIKDVIQLSEALHEKSIVEIAGKIASRKKRIILIAGPSSSGKTTFARRLCIQLRVLGLHPLYLGTDDYFVERGDTPLDERGQPNFEDLEALDVELFNKDMNTLLAGEEADLPSFDFITGSKQFGKRKTTLEPGHPIVIEGIHGLNPELTHYIPDEEKFRIYISPLTQLNIDSHNRIPTTDSRMLRRLVRDYLYRGKTAEGTIREWPKVRAGEDKNIFPYNSEADVFFNSVHIYELAVLKSYAEPLLSAITPDQPEYSEADRMLRFLKYFDTIADHTVIANNSILREFIGGSVFLD